MSLPQNPFLSQPQIEAGHGEIYLANLAESSTNLTTLSVLRTFTYQYPLKLVAPDPVSVARPDVSSSYKPKSKDQETGSLDTKDWNDALVHTVFLLSYGGGLVAGDVISLSITIEAKARLVLLTQGSTKVFKIKPPLGPGPQNNATNTEVSKAAAPLARTSQSLSVNIAGEAILCYLPDPVQPFAESNFSQHQTYILESKQSNLLALDWVTSGRSARGEHWDCSYYSSRNEVFAAAPQFGTGRGRLLLRDNIVLDSQDRAAKLFGTTIAQRVHGAAVIGTLIIHGPVFSGLGDFFAEEFRTLPRLGAPRSILLASSSSTGEQSGQVDSGRKHWRERRLNLERQGNVLWTASTLRNGAFTLVKFSASTLESARQWLRAMLVEEGSVVREVGDRGLMCLK